MVVQLLNLIAQVATRKKHSKSVKNLKNRLCAKTERVLLLLLLLVPFYSFSFTYLLPPPPPPPLNPSIAYSKLRTHRRHSPLWSNSNASLICANFILCVMYSSIFTCPFMYASTSIGTCGFDFQPPNAVPFQVRPVTSWNGRVEISWPAAATPITTDVPQPRAEASRAERITCTLPVQSNEKSTPNS